jgi:hypothetical protein
MHFLFILLLVSFLIPVFMQVLFWFIFDFYVGFILVLILISFYVKFFGFYAGFVLVLASISDLSGSKNHFVNGDNKK